MFKATINTPKMIHLSSSIDQLVHDKTYDKNNLSILT